MCWWWGRTAPFLRHIEAVLPALGEVEVTQATIDDLIAQVPVRAVDPPEVTRLKHDARMAAVIHNALWGAVRPPTDPLVVPDGSYRLRVTAEDLRAVVEQVRREQLPYATGRERVRARVVALLRRQAEVRHGDAPGDAWLRRMARSRPVNDVLDAAWPAVTAPGLIFRLLADPDALAVAADGILTESERHLLCWSKPPRSVRSARWSRADALLVDEAAGLLERMPSFGHVVVDEAQDLSPMQARALARRSTHGSLTVLGDLAQGTAPWAATRWPDLLAHLGKPAAPVLPLTTGFRVPGRVLELANRLLPELAVDVPVATSLRRDGGLWLRQVPELDDAVVTEVRAALAYEGSVAVIVADADAGRVRDALTAAGVDTVDPESPDPLTRVSVLPATVAKGLEYDHVVLVEPAAIVEAEARGLHRLYVVLTRAVSRLSIVHSRPLPAALGAGLRLTATVAAEPEQPVGGRMS